ncbi:MAG: tetratricopeptide repeat protein [Spirochaetes bacterium]|nr:tetratricopeptide repeat protein [Spirochaetota bacterium]
MSLKDVIFISMEGKNDFQIGNFSVRDDAPLPVFVEEGAKFDADMINPENIMTGMIKVIMAEPDNENLPYYRDFIFSVQPDIETRLASTAYQAERDYHFDEAIDMFSVLRALKPDSLETVLNLAVCYDEYSQYLYERGEDKEASKKEEFAFNYFKIVDSFERKTETALFYLGRFYAVKENFVKATEYFEEFLNISADMERKKEVENLLYDINYLGVADEDLSSAQELVQSDMDMEAIEYIDKYIKKYPNSWRGYFTKGTILKKLERYEEALKLFEKSLSLNKKSADVHNEIGLCYMNLGIFSKSELNFYKALNYKPDDLTILANLALMSYKRGAIDVSKKYCEVILDLNPNDLYAKNLLAVLNENTPEYLDRNKIN